ncbi:MAG TPA: heavy-metal-associated domain-containing protein [Acholeplasmataceae bacterium]|nr:heavy-metal-associated domain-containing protein [Acholeplasmataceae bacterium]
MLNKVYQLETLSCPSCIKKIEKVLSKTEGVESVEVLFTSSKVKVTIEETKTDSNTIRKVIERLGYQVLSEK